MKTDSEEIDEVDKRWKQTIWMFMVMVVVFFILFLYTLF
jgi:hypothetical protein